MTIGHTSLNTNDSLGHTGLYSAGATHPASDWIARYEFANGAFATDETGNYNLTNNGASSLNDGTRGYVASFDGVNDFMTGLPSIVGNARSFCVWVKDAVQNNMIMGTSVSLKNMIYYQNSTNMRLYEDGGNFYDYVIPSLEFDNGWKLLTVTISDSLSAKVYVNGVESSTGAQTMLATIKPTGLGEYSSSTFYYDGDMDNATVYDRELTPSEITAIYDFEVL